MDTKCIVYVTFHNILSNIQKNLTASKTASDSTTDSTSSTTSESTSTGSTSESSSTTTTAASLFLENKKYFKSLNEDMYIIYNQQKVIPLTCPYLASPIVYHNLLFSPLISCHCVCYAQHGIKQRLKFFAIIPRNSFLEVKDFFYCDIRT